MGKYDALVAAPRSLLLKIRYNITDNGDNRDWKDCPESATKFPKFLHFQKVPKLSKFPKNSKIVISPCGLTHKT